MLNAVTLGECYAEPPPIHVRAALVLCMLLAGCVTTPTGRHELVLVSASEMNRMGDQAFAQVHMPQALDAYRKARAAGKQPHCKSP